MWPFILDNPAAERVTGLVANLSVGQIVRCGFRRAGIQRLSTGQSHLDLRAAADLFFGKAGDEARNTMESPPSRPASSKSPPETCIHIFEPVAAQFHKKEKQMLSHLLSFFGAGDEARTRYLHLGKVALYRMSYTRI